MRLRHVLAGSVLVLASPAAFAQLQPTGLLYQNAVASVLLTECSPEIDHDDYCRGIVIKSRAESMHLGEGYIRVKLLWTGKSRRGEPDALILGEYGGSGGHADLFALSFLPRIAVRKLSGERFDTVTADAGSRPLRFNIPFDIEYFNGAAHAGAITLPLPALWAKGDFAIDLDALARRTYSASELDFRALATREELQAWASDRSSTTRLYPPYARYGTPVTATALVEMMLSGHADQAKGLLDRAWPHQWEGGDKPLGGKTEFWAAMCRAVLREPSWGRFGLGRVPHADLIVEGAAVKA